MSLLAVTSGDIASGVVPAEGVDFDGVSDYLSRSTDLVGNIDSKTFTFSAWVCPTGANNIPLYNSTDATTNNRTYLELRPSNGNFVLFLQGVRADFAVIMSVTTTEIIPANTFSNVIVSADNATNIIKVSINDKVYVYSDSYTNSADSIKFSLPIHYVGFRYNYKTLGRLSNVFLDYTYRDLSIEANRRLFITADGKPA